MASLQVVEIDTNWDSPNGPVVKGMYGMCGDKVGALQTGFFIYIKGLNRPTQLTLSVKWNGKGVSKKDFVLSLFPSWLDLTPDNFVELSTDGQKLNRYMNESPGYGKGGTIL